MESLDKTETLEEIPYEIYLEYFIEHLTIKEFGVLSMVSKTLKRIFDSNEFWKAKYLETTPVEITDISIHIGDYYERLIYKEDELIDNRLLSARYLRDFNKYNKTKYTNTPPPGYKFYEKTFEYIHYSDNIYNPSKHCIKNNHPRLRSLISLNIPGTTASFWIKDQPKSVQIAYIDYLKTTGITRCNCVNHYDPSTLIFKGIKVNYKSFKKMILKKLRTKQKKELKNFTSKCENKINVINRYKKELKRLEKELQNLEESKFKSLILSKDLDNSINSL